MSERRGGIRRWVVVSFTIAALSCMQKPEAPKYEFFYYPKVNMYYNVAAGQYIYSVDSARTWNTINETSPEPPATLGAAQIIKTGNKQVWNENEQHRSQYNGIILNVAAAEDEMVNNDTEVKDKKSLKKTAAKPTHKDQEKKGLGKFLNKIFGKKKKKEETN